MSNPCGSTVNGWVAVVVVVVVVADDDDDDDDDDDATAVADDDDDAGGNDSTSSLSPDSTQCRHISSCINSSTTIKHTATVRVVPSVTEK